LNPTGAVRAGGASLIAGAVGFMGVFGYLAASFDYPDILEGPAAVGFMRLAQAFTVISAISMMLGLMRWPSIHWHLATAWSARSSMG
jgi:hypothetical protein